VIACKPLHGAIRDGKQPRAEAGFTSKIFEFGRYDQEYLMHDILGGGGVAPEPPRIAPHERRMLSVGDFELSLRYA
jgi:hypothetical protein